MKLPKSLYSGYSELRRSRVVTKRATDEEALSHFNKVINSAQPTEEGDRAIHKFIRGMYNENKRKFLSFIKNTIYECLVLWTESSVIVQCLGLRGVVYIKWDDAKRLYHTTKFQSRKLQVSNDTHMSASQDISSEPLRVKTPGEQKTGETSVSNDCPEESKEPSGVVPTPSSFKRLIPVVSTTPWGDH
jgi:hypothetical protein